MDDFTKAVFDAAVLKEQAAARLYSGLSAKAQSAAERGLFLRLAEEEKVHESLFGKMSLEVLRIVNAGALSRLNLLSLGPESLSRPETLDLRSAVKYAQEQEQQAIDDYEVIREHIGFGAARDALGEIIIQEKRHKNQLGLVLKGLSVDHLEGAL